MSRADERLAALAKDIGPRPACGDGEHEAGDYILELFEGKELPVEQQRIRSVRTYSFTFITYFVVAILVAAASSQWRGWAALVGVLLAASFWLELDTRPVVARLMPKGVSRNLIGRFHAPGSGVPKVVVVTAHYDSARAALPFAPRMVRRFRLTFWLTAGSVWAVCVLAVAHWVLGFFQPGISWIWYAMLVPAAYLLVPIALYVHRELAMPFVDGANDNASGVVAMLEVMERVMSNRRHPARAQQSEGEDAAQGEPAGEPARSSPGEASPEPVETFLAPPTDIPEPPEEGAGGAGSQDWGDVAFTDWLGVDQKWDIREEGQRLGDYSRIEPNARAARREEPDASAFDEFAEPQPDQPMDGLEAPDLAFDEPVASAEPESGSRPGSNAGLMDKEIWFVATACEEAGTVGMIEFLKRYGTRLKDAYFINLDNVGSGRLAFIADEGIVRVRGADNLLLGLARQVADDKGFDIVAHPYHLLTTDATAAMARGHRAVSVMAFDERGMLPNWHWSTDTVERVRTENVESAADFVYELIRAL